MLTRSDCSYRLIECVTAELYFEWPTGNRAASGQFLA